MAVLSVTMLVLTACTSQNAVNAEDENKTPAGGAGGYGYKIAVVTHGAAGDAFWSIVKNGVEKAGADMGDTIMYSSDGDPQKQAQLIDAAVNQKVDGLVVSMANPDALKSSVGKAVAAGIPVITINSGAGRSKEFGALTHIGQDEKVAGEAVGAELRKQGIKKAICVIHEAGNVGLEERCAAVAGTLGAPVENLQVDINNLQSSQSTIKSKLQSDTAVDGVVTLGGPVAGVAAAAIGEASSAARLATFDLNADVAKGVQDGKILFAVDQQPYLQGYVAVTMLTQYKANLNVLGGGQQVLTGPTLVTKDNAAQIARLAAAGTR
ncbi:substrate-binding domain-containing protein [Actinoplanes sp. NEAU-A12]|uniref:Substrate-binding domain-containing protein n=1 Tax=Actinoplanes sandaracinus TaxID=3045177 RepID=A0ABT6WWU9_9ACTN|nr:substrate-binding domain-containing protein [Actinoplanes sandaracinus]MDI6104221.1 substrate-binding domain-containing protein [Actinoplanes sandaracinus]